MSLTSHKGLIRVLGMLALAIIGSLPGCSSEFSAGMAASQGLAQAQFCLGWMCFRGEGIPRDPVEAAEWLERSAEQGLAIAQSNLGLMYLKGEDLPRDDTSAVKWLSLAANQGFAAAQQKLGAMYEHGRGVPQDNVTAFKWYSLSAAKGLALGVEARDSISKKLTPSQLAEAEQSAMQWFERHADHEKRLTVASDPFDG